LDVDIAAAFLLQDGKKVGEHLSLKEETAMRAKGEKQERSATAFEFTRKRRYRSDLPI